MTGVCLCPAGWLGLHCTSSESDTQDASTISLYSKVLIQMFSVYMGTSGVLFCFAVQDIYYLSMLSN